MEAISISVVVVEESESHYLHPRECHKPDLTMTHSRRLRHVAQGSQERPWQKDGRKKQFLTAQELSPLPGTAEQLSRMVKSAL